MHENEIQKHRMHSLIQAVLFDVDGTLYNHSLLRTLMTLKIFFSSVINPLNAGRNIKVISSYRKSQEIIRKKDSYSSDLYKDQIKLASQLSGSDENYVNDIVRKWFETAPLSLIPFCKRKNLEYTFEWLYKNKINTGLFSDYYCNEKASVLGIEKYVSVYVSSMDKDVGVFKPNPKGFLIAAGKLGVKPGNILFVGDRADADLTGANSAGMKAALLGKLPYGDTANYELKDLSGVINILSN